VRAFTFLLFVFILFGKVYAQNYFDVEVDTKKVPYNKELNIEFSYSLNGFEESDFLVRPRMTVGAVSVYHEAENEWVSQGGLWTAMPTLQKDMNIKVDLQGESELYFEIQNTVDQKIFETPKIMIWGGNIYTDYIEKVNQNLKQYIYEEKATPVSFEQVPTPDPKPLSLLAKVIKYIDDII